MKKERTGLKAFLAIVVGVAFFFTFITFPVADESVRLAPLQQRPGTFEMYLRPPMLPPGNNNLECATFQESILITGYGIGTGGMSCPSEACMRQCEQTCYQTSRAAAQQECQQRVQDFISIIYCESPCVRYPIPPTPTTTCQVTGGATGSVNSISDPAYCDCYGSATASANFYYGCGFDVQ